MTWLEPDPNQDERDRQARYAESPEGLARGAFARGDGFFQLMMPAGALAGEPSLLGSSENRIEGAGDPHVLALVEREGWRLEHVGYVFVETGATTTNRMFNTGQGVVTRGVVQGVYLFRRAEPGDRATAPAPVAG